MAGDAVTAPTENSGSRLIEEGMLLFAGDVITPGKPMTIALCATGKNDRLLLRLDAGGEFAVTSTTIESRKGSAAFLNSLPVCTLPGVDRMRARRMEAGPRMRRRIRMISENDSLVFRPNLQRATVPPERSPPIPK